MKKAITLIELLIGVVLMGVVVLGAISFDIASKTFFKSTERKVNVLNDLTFVLEHLHKNIMQGGGTVTNLSASLALDWSGNVLTINQSTGATVSYTFDVNNHTIVFNNGITSVTLTSRLESLGNNVRVEPAPDFGFAIDTMGFIDNPNNVYHVRENPRVQIEEQYFFPLVQSCS